MYIDALGSDPIASPIPQARAGSMFPWEPSQVPSPAGRNRKLIHQPEWHRQRDRGKLCETNVQLNT